jgi:hypothetical protein
MGVDPWLRVGELSLILYCDERYVSCYGTAHIFYGIVVRGELSGK